MTNEYEKYLQSEDWAKKRLELFELRGRKCEICWSTENLQVHHKTYANIFDEAPDDLLIVCKRCHNGIHRRSKLTVSIGLFRQLSTSNYSEKERRIKKFTKIRKKLGVPYSKDMECKFDYSEYRVLLKKLFKAHGLKLSSKVTPEIARQEILSYLEMSPYDRARKYRRKQ